MPKRCMKSISIWQKKLKRELKNKSTLLKKNWFLEHVLAEHAVKNAVDHVAELKDSKLDAVPEKIHEADVWVAQKAQIKAEQRALKLKGKAAEVEPRVKIAKQHTKAIEQHA